LSVGAGEPAAVQSDRQRSAATWDSPHFGWHPTDPESPGDSTAALSKGRNSMEKAACEGHGRIGSHTHDSDDPQFDPSRPSPRRRHLKESPTFGNGADCSGSDSWAVASSPRADVAAHKEEGRETHRRLSETPKRSARHSFGGSASRTPTPSSARRSAPVASPRTSDAQFIPRKGMVLPRARCVAARSASPANASLGTPSNGGSKSPFPWSNVDALPLGSPVRDSQLGIMGPSSPAHGTTPRDPISSVLRHSLVEHSSPGVPKFGANNTVCSETHTPAVTIVYHGALAPPSFADEMEGGGSFAGPGEVDEEWPELVTRFPDDQHDDAVTVPQPSAVVAGGSRRASFPCEADPQQPGGQLSPDPAHRRKRSSSVGGDLASPRRPEWNPSVAVPFVLRKSFGSPAACSDRPMPFCKSSEDVVTGVDAPLNLSCGNSLSASTPRFGRSPSKSQATGDTPPPLARAPTVAELLRTPEGNPPKKRRVESTADAATHAALSSPSDRPSKAAPESTRCPPSPAKSKSSPRRTSIGTPRSSTGARGHTSASKQQATRSPGGRASRSPSLASRSSVAIPPSAAPQIHHAEVAVLEEAAIAGSAVGSSATNAPVVLEEPPTAGLAVATSETGVGADAGSADIALTVASPASDAADRGVARGHVCSSGATAPDTDPARTSVETGAVDGSPPAKRRRRSSVTGLPLPEEDAPPSPTLAEIMATPTRAPAKARGPKALTPAQLKRQVAAICRRYSEPSAEFRPRAAKPKRASMAGEDAVTRRKKKDNPDALWQQWHKMCESPPKPGEAVSDTLLGRLAMRRAEAGTSTPAQPLDASDSHPPAEAVLERAPLD